MLYGDGSWLETIAVVVVLVVVVCIMAVAMRSSPEPSSSFFQWEPCALWAGYEDKACQVLLSQESVISYLDISLEEYHEVRISFSGSELLVSQAENILVRDDRGDKVYWQGMRLFPGVYFVEKAEADKPANFRLTQPQDAGDSATLLAEYVRLLEEEE